MVLFLFTAYLQQKLIFKITDKNLGRILYLYSFKLLQLVRTRIFNHCTYKIYLIQQPF